MNGKEEEFERLEMSFNFTVNHILAELMKPENVDIAIAIASHEKSFKFHFSAPFAKALSFDEYSCFTHNTNAALKGSGIEMAEVVNMSDAYDIYLQNLEVHKSMSTLNEDMAPRWKKICDTFDDGWSGYVYALICRRIQDQLGDLMNEN